MDIDNYIRFEKLDLNEKVLDPHDRIFESILNFKTKSSNKMYGNSNVSLMKSDVKSFFASNGISLHGIFYTQNESFSFNSLNDYMKNARFVSAFDLPLYFNQSDTEVQFLIPNIDRDYSEFPVLYTNINFNGNCTLDSHSSYVHEITHTQLNSIKGSYRYYSNGEVFPYFLQLVYCDLKNENMSADFLERLLFDLKCDAQDYISFTNCSDKKLQEIAMGRGFLNGTQLLKYQAKYIASSVEAILMFETYKKSSTRDKRFMINEANLIFNGKKTVEQSLDDLEVPFRNHMR